MSSTPDRPYAGDVTPQEAWQTLQDDPRAVLVDVRTDAEWRYVGIPDTSALGPDGPRRTVLVEWVSYPSGQTNAHFVEQLRAALDDDAAGGDGADAADGGADAGAPDRPLLFLCRSGVRSVAAATAATRAGLGRALNVLEGFEGDVGPDAHRGHAGWRAAGLPWRQA
ncbi:rhodanese-like domain-containing protein [Cellulomonas marina]|uniref:Rhodanese-related sulfurtransferase n=1 Tax=Cellulomonas marina TaxID=988821 RepID=A0A1I0ZJ66_9CELL|nr:rhodanese-like domain-containing protein [Cellulomonas marina]GIG28543.1 sulfurtransferase [Cellulomonas marina]SFB24570.1 Rhodanese-related sulfurtransferase [Cellulomonas marina]